MTDEQCGACRYAMTDPQDLSMIFCRRYPPTVQVLGMQNGSVSKATSYPQVTRQGWCGEFASRPAVTNRIESEV